MAAIPTMEMAALRRDFDDFDADCDHLLVIDHSRADGANKVVGTYRLIRRVAVARHHRRFVEPHAQPFRQRLPRRRLLQHRKRVRFRVPLRQPLDLDAARAVAQQPHVAYAAQRLSVTSLDHHWHHELQSRHMFRRGVVVLHELLYHLFYRLRVQRGGQRVSFRQQLEGLHNVRPPRVHGQVIAHLVHHDVGGMVVARRWQIERLAPAAREVHQRLLPRERQQRRQDRRFACARRLRGEDERRAMLDAQPERGGHPRRQRAGLHDLYDREGLRLVPAVPSPPALRLVDCAHGQRP
ncbi:MAG: GNAT family N-acetyltransferase [Chloroflexi bacterium]|nr:GNAT family N-acetyltransferase [Chloroflexota bacterium]